MAENRLLSLQAEGVSVWLDVLGRDVLDSGRLQQYLDDDGMRGVTSNPTIFQKSIAESTAYDEQIASLHSQGRTAEEICWELMTCDVRSACDVFRPLYEATSGEHGYVSLEVSP